MEELRFYNDVKNLFIIINKNNLFYFSPRISTLNINYYIFILKTLLILSI